jgi:putative phage-type endonuclease
MIDRQAWLEARRKGLGSTDGPAILGLDRWRSGRDVYADKNGLEPDRPVTAPMEWGLRLEDAIAFAWSEKSGGATRRVPMRRAKHVTTFPMIASIDRLGVLNGETIVVELKSARVGSEGYVKEEDQDDVEPALRIPPGYYVQVQHQLEVANLERAELAVLFGGSDFRRYRIPRDRDFGADLVEELGAWWRDYYLAGVEPPVGPDDGPGLVRRFPRSTALEKVPNSEILLVVAELLRLDDQVEELERERNLFANRVKDYLGDAAKMEVPGATVSWASHVRKTVGWKEVAEAYRRLILDRARDGERPFTFADRPVDPDLLRDLDAVVSIYSREADVRPFRVDRKKEG